MKDRKARISEQQSVKKVVREESVKKVVREESHSEETNRSTTSTTKKNKHIITVTQQPRQTLKQQRKIVFRSVQTEEKKDLASL